MSDNNGLCATLAVELIVDIEDHIDLTMYKYAMNQKDLKNLDYFLGRVSNNPEYCNNLNLDYHKLFHPTLKDNKTPILSEVDTNELPIEGVYKQALVMRSQTSVKQDEQTRVDLIADKFVEIASQSENKVELYYMFAFHAFLANVKVNNKKLVPYLEDINNTYCYQYKEIYQYLELTTHFGKKIRNEFVEIMSQILGDE